MEQKKTGGGLQRKRDIVLLPAAYTAAGSSTHLVSSSSSSALKRHSFLLLAPSFLFLLRSPPPLFLQYSSRPFLRPFCFGSFFFFFFFFLAAKKLSPTSQFDVELLKRRSGKSRPIPVFFLSLLCVSLVALDFPPSPSSLSCPCDVSRGLLRS